MAMDFHQRAFCPCGSWSSEAPFGDLFHIHRSVCPQCGAPKSMWKVETVRWKSTAVWYKPWTWGSGYWFGYEVVGEESEDEDQRQPIGTCLKCGSPVYTIEGFCGGCRLRGR